MSSHCPTSACSRGLTTLHIFSRMLGIKSISVRLKNNLFTGDDLKIKLHSRYERSDTGRKDPG